jgi:hypothetical protein
MKIKERRRRLSKIVYCDETLFHMARIVDMNILGLFQSTDT